MSTRHPPTSPPAGPRLARRAKEAETAAPPIVERPDGYYWIGDGELGEFGPFETYELARANRDAGAEEALTPADTLRDVEREIGISELPGAEAGEAADSTSPPPHLERE